MHIDRENNICGCNMGYGPMINTDPYQCNKCPAGTYGPKYDGNCI